MSTLPALPVRAAATVRPPALRFRQRTTGRRLAVVVRSCRKAHKRSWTSVARAGLSVEDDDTSSLVVLTLSLFRARLAPREGTLALLRYPAIHHRRLEGKRAVVCEADLDSSQFLVVVSVDGQA